MSWALHTRLYCLMGYKTAHGKRFDSRWSAWCSLGLNAIEIGERVAAFTNEESRQDDIELMTAFLDGKFDGDRKQISALIARFSSCVAGRVRCVRVENVQWGRSEGCTSVTF